MEQNLVVLQGKVFTVDIQSMFGSTNYGWCLTSLPSGIVLMAAENITSGMGPVTQRFYFGAVSSEVINVDIQFSLICWSDFTQTVDSCTVHVRIIPSDSVNYTPYSENANASYGCSCNETPSLKYGFPCEQVSIGNAAMPYGVMYNGSNVGASTPIFANNVGASTPIFGNNVGTNTPIFANNVGTNTPIFKNSAVGNTPIFGSSVPAVAYGYPPVLKYGFPGCC